VGSFPKTRGTVRAIAALILLTSVLLAGEPASAQAPSPPQHWLVVSDVHFDPFTDPRIVERLAEAPAERWRAIFQSVSPMPFADYGADTNYPLLESALDAMRSQIPDPAVVIVTGDFLAHGFRARFERVAQHRTDEAYDDFVDKTVAFLADEFRAAFPRARLIPVIGNNDNYCGDYQSTDHSAFLTRLAVAWGGSVGAPDPTAFVKQFSIGGYYTVPLPAGGAQAVVLNDILWSPKFTNACGDKNTDPGGDELAWLQQTLRAQTGHPVWVIAHIPPGVDAFATVKSASAQPTMMLAGTYNDALVSLLETQPPQIAMALAGHTHMNAFRVIGPGATRPVTPMLVIPSISPIFGNNPSFSVLTVDAAGAQVSDDDVFVLFNLPQLAKNPRGNATWGREYDFNSVFGGGPIDAAHLSAVQQEMFEDGPARHRYEQFSDGESGRAPIDASWRAYWCANVALTASAYAACAMPQVLRSLPAQPTPPPAPSPSASP
jgi:sphingomyelin phosphodiesterase acid-like 3